MLRAIFHILRDKVPYRDPGPGRLDTVDRERAKKRLVHRLQKLGYQVDVREAA